MCKLQNLSGNLDQNIQKVTMNRLKRKVSPCGLLVLWVVFGIISLIIIIYHLSHSKFKWIWNEERLNTTENRP